MDGHGDERSNVRLSISDLEFMTHRGYVKFANVLYIALLFRLGDLFSLARPFLAFSNRQLQALKSVTGQ